MIKLISPTHNQVVNTLKDNVISYINAMHKQSSLVKDDYSFNGLNWGLSSYIKVEDYVSRNKHKDFILPVTFIFESDSKINTLLISEDINFNKAISYVSKKKQINVYNLKRNTKYYYKVINDKSSSEIRSFIVSDYARCLRFGTLRNVRDIGGYPTSSGKRIKQELVLRGSELTTESYVYQSKTDYSTQNHVALLTENACYKLSKFLDHGVEMDLRGDAESNYLDKSKLDNKKHKFDYYRFPIAGYDKIFAPEREDVKKKIKKIFELFAEADKSPIYSHCWGGADRTGTIFFLLGALLGMSYVDLIIEYELTSFMGNIRRHYIKSDVSWLKFVEFYEYLENYSKKIKENNISKTVEHLLINYFDIDKITINKIKNTFLE